MFLVLWWAGQVRDEIYEAFENIYPVLTEFRKIQQWYVTCMVEIARVAR